MFSRRVLALLVLQVGLAQSFPWDIVVGTFKQLEFYYNGTLTHAENIQYDYITSIDYDPIQNRVLFTNVNYSNISIFILDLSTMEKQQIFTKNSTYMELHLAYDPVTQVLYWCEAKNMYSLSLKPFESFEKKVEGNLLRTLNHSCRDIAVDICRGYVYWITEHVMERARFDGSEREVLIDEKVFFRAGLAIDQQNQTIYWGERNYGIKDGYSKEQNSLESADLNGENRKTLHRSYEKIDRTTIISLAISKDFIFWRYVGQTETWQIPKKTSEYVKPKVYSSSMSTCWNCYGIAANYSIKELTKTTQSCEALNSLGKESTHGFTPQICDVPVCHNYCFQGDCSVSAEGQPKCRCRDGYSGNRCEVNACQEYCLNSGVCSLNEEEEPVCQCTDDYEGKRCDVPVFLNTFVQNISMWRDKHNVGD